ncbi:hypothetical protein Taro_000607 [Colocasia esculenta]|uniref:CCHC-type domain-containing protein n=1 Tax=Colocasia esculenta TaxID=4460 RepID=A0A843TBA3_COLES|nr:hypothetical protein [Colocasia esculenta]
MDELQRTVQGMTQALNNVIQARARNGARDLYGNFQRINPPRFNGTPDPDEAENWVKAMERIFRVMQCSEREKVLLATFQLDRDARAWWETASRQLPNINIEWDEFLELFNTKYFSKGNREKKELLMDANMRPTQRLVLACQQAAQLLEEALEATKEIKEVTNKNGKRKYHDDKKATQQTKRNNEISRIICLHCHKPGHVDKECWRKIGTCLRYGNTRHQLRECPLLEESATSVKDLNSMTKGKRLNNGGEAKEEEISWGEEPFKLSSSFFKF